MFGLNTLNRHQLILPNATSILRCNRTISSSHRHRSPQLTVASYDRRRPPPRRFERELEPRDETEMYIQRIRSMRPNARLVALDQLLRIEEQGAYAGLVSGSQPQANKTQPQQRTTPSVDGGNDDDSSDELPVQRLPTSLDERDRRLVTELVAGVTRWRRRLDYVLTHLPKPTNLDKMDVPLRLMLRMGAYELLELKRPPHMVNEYVEMSKNVIHVGCSKVANAVLNELCRAMKADKVPSPPILQSTNTTTSTDDSSGSGSGGADANDFKAVAESIAIGFSHPTWMVARWLRQFGVKDTLALLKFNNSRPSYSVRVADFTLLDSLSDTTSSTHHQQEQKQQEFSYTPSQYLPNEFIKVNFGLQRLLSQNLLASGKIQVQDEGAGLVVNLLDPQPDDVILDACAAPGGKTLYSAARMQGRGHIVAADISAARLKALSAAAQSQGVADIVQVVPTDVKLYRVRAKEMAGSRVKSTGRELPLLFDKVLLDAPCSGTGVLAKRADLRWRRKYEDVKQLCQLQDELLDAAATVVKPGGLLVYSTCSLEQDENQQRVRAFVDRHPEFVVEDASEAGGVPKECITADGFLQTLPHVHSCDGAFGARLRRKSIE